jgi:hypothetical protein
MCSYCENWIYEAVLRYMAQTGVHLEIALRLVRDTIMQNCLHDQAELGESDEVTLHKMRSLVELMDKTAERLRSMNPAALRAVVDMIDTST